MTRYRLTMKSGDGEVHEFFGTGGSAGGVDERGHETTARYTLDEARSKLRATAEQYDPIHTGKYAGGKIVSARIIADGGLTVEWYRIKAGRLLRILTVG